MVDNFSKFVHLGAIPNRNSLTLANWALTRVFTVFGPPKIIKSDNGGEF